MMKYYLVRNLHGVGTGEIWSASPVADDLNFFLKLCRENWHGDFIVVRGDKMPSCRARFKREEWIKYFGEQQQKPNL